MKTGQKFKIKFFIKVWVFGETRLRIRVAEILNGCLVKPD